jgi:hypothetical protein
MTRWERMLATNSGYRPLIGHAHSGGARVGASFWLGGSMPLLVTALVPEASTIYLQPEVRSCFWRCPEGGRRPLGGER